METRRRGTRAGGCALLYCCFCAAALFPRAVGRSGAAPNCARFCPTRHPRGCVSREGGRPTESAGRPAQPPSGPSQSYRYATSYAPHTHSAKPPTDPTMQAGVPTLRHPHPLLSHRRGIRALSHSSRGADVCAGGCSKRKHRSPTFTLSATLSPTAASTTSMRTRRGACCPPCAPSTRWCRGTPPRGSTAAWRSLWRRRWWTTKGNRCEPRGRNRARAVGTGGVAVTAPVGGPAQTS
jgi:hypothetical protein